MAKKKPEYTQEELFEVGKNVSSLNLKGVRIPESLKSNEHEIWEWLLYKQEKKQTYKSRGLQALWKRLESIHPSRRKESIENSMANNWAGIYESKGTNGTQSREIVGLTSEADLGLYDGKRTNSK